MGLSDMEICNVSILPSLGLVLFTRHIQFELWKLTLSLHCSKYILSQDKTYELTLTSYRRYDLILAIWPHNITAIMTSYRKYDLITAIWPHNGNMTSYRQYDLIPAIWTHTGDMTSCRRYDLIPAIWPHIDNMTL